MLTFLILMGWPAAVEGRTVKDMVLTLIETHLREMEKKGQLPKGKG
jgi:hypothetical protein